MGWGWGQLNSLLIKPASTLLLVTILAPTLLKFTIPHNLCGCSLHLPSVSPVYSKSPWRWVCVLKCCSHDLQKVWNTALCVQGFLPTGLFILTETKCPTMSAGSGNYSMHENFLYLCDTQGNTKYKDLLWKWGKGCIILFLKRHNNLLVSVLWMTLGRRGWRRKELFSLLLLLLFKGLEREFCW